MSLLRSYRALRVSVVNHPACGELFLGAFAVDQDLGFVFASCAGGRVAALDPNDGHVVGEDWSVSGADVIDWSPSRRHLYVAGAISGDLAIIGVSSRGEMGLFAIEEGAIYAHCVTTDDAGHVFVCDMRQGRLLVDDDSFAAVRQ